MKIVVLTGAGISAESGIRTFRAEDGLWEDHRVDDVATPEGFERNPTLVQDFYNQRRRQLLQPDIQPNAAHLALAALEQSHHEVFVVTQNVDDLHERAGSKHLLHMHGELFAVFCQNCSEAWSWQADLSITDTCPHCQQQGSIRPDIVWFGEMPKQMEKIDQKLSECDLFISIGTSGHVYPAAGFVQHAKQSGAHTVELNLEPSKGNRYFDQHIYGQASEVVPNYVKQLIEQHELPR